MTDEQKDPPIVPQEFSFGVSVIDFGDARVARGRSRRPASACKHRRLVYDQSERRIWCQDCERDVEPFDAFTGIAESVAAKIDGLKRREKELKEAENFQIRSRAAKAIDQVWRSRNMVPACPTCGHGLLPEHFANGRGVTLGRDYAAARINARDKK